MKSVLISINPKWCSLIVDGKKTIEVRKTRPKIETPFKCYIYCTYGQGLIERFDPDYPNMLLAQNVSKNATWGNCCNGKVIGEFICDKILDIFISCSGPNMKGYPFPGTGLTDREIMDYLGNGKSGYGWHISDLKIYDRPKSLSEFKVRQTNVVWSFLKRIERPPQSWCYVED